MPEMEPESKLPPDFRAIVEAVNTSAQNCSGDCLKLLALLRLLEGLHREICDGLFQASLPTNRHALYTLLRDIETEGGWPYIHRMKLQSLLANLPAEPDEDVSSEPADSSECQSEVDASAG